MTDCDTDSSTDVLRNEEKMELVIKGLFILVGLCIVKCDILWYIMGK